MEISNQIIIHQIEEYTPLMGEPGFCSPDIYPSELIFFCVLDKMGILHKDTVILRPVLFNLDKIEKKYNFGSSDKIVPDDLVYLGLLSLMDINKYIFEFCVDKFKNAEKK